MFRSDKKAAGKRDFRPRREESGARALNVLERNVVDETLEARFELEDRD
jgi:hypothetical protein